MSISVNGEKIPEEAVQYELNRLIRFHSSHMPREEIEAQMDLLRNKAREQAIGAKLLIEEAYRLDLVVPDRDVDEHWDKMVEQAGGEEAFNAMLQKQGLSEPMVRASIQQGRRVDMLVERITQGIPEPSEEEMKAHYEAHRREYRKPERAQAQHILMRIDAESSPEDRSVAKSRLMGIHKQIMEGADFADLAAAHSNCPSGRKSGGSLGWINRGTMVEEFDRQVFSMEVGAVSDVLETSLGYHLVKVTEREASTQASYEEVEDKVRDFLRHAGRGEAIAEHVAELREKAVIEET